MTHSPAFGVLADLDLYEDAMRAAAEALEPGSAIREAQALAHDLRARVIELPGLAGCWNRFADSHARTLEAFAVGTTLAQRLDALEQHVEALLDLQRACLDIAGGPR